MTSLLGIFAEPTPTEPSINWARLCDDLGDNPATHRWRAGWDKNWDGVVIGIELRAYPVVKLTPQGAQIDPEAWREYKTSGTGWHLTGEKRFVTNTGAQAWAKPTQEDALHSIAVRLERWARQVYRDTVKVRQAAAIVQALRPDDGYLAETALKRLIGA
jgi:hypothetical protein